MQYFFVVVVVVGFKEFSSLTEGGLIYPQQSPHCLVAIVFVIRAATNLQDHHRTIGDDHFANYFMKTCVRSFNQ